MRWKSKRGKKRETVESGVSRVLEVKKGVSGGNLSVGLALVENFRISITLTPTLSTAYSDMLCALK